MHARLALAFKGFQRRREHLIQCLQLTYQGSQPLTQDLREGEVPEELPGLWHCQLRGDCYLLVGGQGPVQMLEEGVQSAA